MNLGIGSRLLLTSLAVLVVLELAAAFALRGALRRTVDAQVVAELQRHAASVRAAVSDLPGLDAQPGQRVVERIAAATGTRVEVIRGDGEVIASAGGPILGDPLARPEIRAALDPELRGGLARRGGRVLVAVPFPYGDGTAVVRASTDDKAIKAAQRRIYRLLAIGGVIGLGIAIVITLVTTTLVRHGELALRT